MKGTLPKASHFLRGKDLAKHPKAENEYPHIDKIDDNSRNAQ